MSDYNTNNLETPIMEKKTPKRNLLMILPSMIELVPKEDEEFFRRDLERELQNAAYTAPENIYAIWVNVQTIISKRFKIYNNVTELPEWCSLFIDIWTNTKT